MIIQIVQKTQSDYSDTAFSASVVNASLIGLSLSYCVSLAGVFQYGVRLSTDIESLVSQPAMCMCINFSASWIQ